MGSRVPGRRHAIPIEAEDVEGRPSLDTEEHARWWKMVGQDELRQILFWRWDPIGVRDDFPATKDEYDGYGGPLVNVLREGGAVAEVVDHLRQVEIKWMGDEMSGYRNLKELGYFIVEWYCESLARWVDDEP